MWKRRLAWVAAGLLAVTLVTGIVMQQRIRQIRFVMSMFSGTEMVDTFRNLDKIFPTAVIHKGDKPFQFAQGEVSIPATYNFRGEERPIADLLATIEATGLLVIKDDAILFEQYYLGNTEATRWISWSMAKSFVGTLVGIAVSEGKINSIEDPITLYVPELSVSGYNNVRIKDILQMSSGIGWNEDYSDPKSDINVMGRTLALGGSFDWFVSTLRNERAPGTLNHYNSMDTQALGMLLSRATGMSVSAYLEEKLWTQIGMEHDGFFLTDRSGTELAFCGLNASLRDYAKLGRLYMHGGSWEGKQVVPASWIHDALTPDAPHLIPGATPHSPKEFGYGYQWWIPEHGDGTFLARGIYGQHIYVNPKKKLIITMTAANRNFGAHGGGESNDHTKESLAMIESIAAAL